MRAVKYLLTIVLILSAVRSLAAQDQIEPRQLAHASPMLKVLTWNIWMMPGFTFQSPANKRRAAAIADVLNNQDVDVLCLEKAFDGRARKIIAERLHTKFPYMFGPANRKLGFKINSGVWVLSRIPLYGYREIEFNKAVGIERFSRKGAVFLTGTIAGKRFIVIATHLEGEEGPMFTESHQRIRDAQVRQIRDDLLTPPVTPGTLVIIAGDFATPRIQPCSEADLTEAYKRTLATLEARNGPEHRITLNDNRRVNTLAEDNTARTDELDYIFIRDNGTNVQTVWQRRVFRGTGWDKKKDRPDLSYRYAVEVMIKFPE